MSLTLPGTKAAYSGFSSHSTALRPYAAATPAVVPLPPNGSITAPPAGHPAKMHGSISAGGNVAKWAPLNGRVGTDTQSGDYGVHQPRDGRRERCVVAISECVSLAFRRDTFPARMRVPRYRLLDGFVVEVILWPLAQQENVLVSLCAAITYALRHRVSLVPNDVLAQIPTIVL